MKISRQQLQQADGDGILSTDQAEALYHYLGHLASGIFEDSWLFPIALTAIGPGIVYLGILWQRHEVQITGRVQALLPQALRELLAARGRS